MINIQNKKMLVWGVTAVCLIGCACGGYVYWKKISAPQTVVSQPQVVEVITVSQKAINPEASFVAKIESPEKVGLRARVTGFLQEKLFNEGEVVKVGQPLFVIEPVNFEAQVRQAEANLAKAEAAAVNAKAQYNRIETLYKTKDVSAAKRDEAEAAYSSAKATVEQMKALLDLAKKDLEYTTIVSPMNGKIGEKAFSVGELIGPTSGVLAEIVSIDPMNAVFSISENDILRLQDDFGAERDIEATFILSDGSSYPYTGQISFVDVSLDEAMNTLRLKVSLANPERHLISGQYGRVVLRGVNPIQEIVIPMKAVQRSVSETYVYVVDADNKIVKRTVHTGAELSNFDVIIDSGLSTGERVVVAGFQKIRPQMTVTPKSVQGE